MTGFVEVDVTKGWQTQGRSTRDRKRKKQPQRGQRPLSEAARPVAAKAAGEARPETSRQATASGGWRSTPARASAMLSIRPEDYSYVYSDLKRIAVLAVSIFAVLIALSFIIK